MDRLRTFVSQHPDLTALAAFAVLTLAMTYPQPLRMTDTKDYGDPLLNAWIMWWEVDAVASGNFAGFFDANIFFPHFRTLAYSEFLIPQTLVAAPLILLTGHPLFAYNVVLLLSFVVTAFAMYLLGRQLTGCTFAGFVAGLALAFSPFMFSHLSHIQVIGAAGIPLAFLFLHRYFDGGRRRDLVLFSAVYIGQALANAYYALYLTYAAGAYILYRAIRDRRSAQPAFWKDMAIHAVLSLVFLVPWFGQYYVLRSELGFVRNMQFDGGWYSFLAAPEYSVLYGTLTAPFYAAEGSLFPGLTVLGLAFAGVVTGRALMAERGESTAPPPAAARWGYHLAGFLIILGWLAVLAISVSGGFTTTIAGIALRVSHFRNPLLGLIIGIGARAALRRLYPGLGRGGNWLGEPQRFYAWLLFMSVLLTLGPNGLYRLFYEYAPGFDGVRAVARIHIVTVFCLAVFVAYGTRWVAEKLSTRGWRSAAIALPALICIEGFSIMPMVDVAWGDDVPEVYRWLAEQDGDHAVIEYPINIEAEFPRLFYSMVHRKKMVNGMSGYQSPVYREMRSRMGSFPSTETFEDLRALGVRWIIVHPDEYGDLWDERRFRFQYFADEIQAVTRFDNAVVYEMTEPWLTREDFHRRRAETEAQWTSIPKQSWRVESNRNPFLAELAIDDDVATRWNSEPQVPGDYLMVDLGGEFEVGSLVTALDVHPHDYPRGYRVEVSLDGQEWRTVAEDHRVHLPIVEFLDPLNLRFEITFPPTAARYVRIVQIGEDPVYVWTIHELDVRTPR